jgi:PAS domain S-box-containing protein
MTTGLFLGFLLSLSVLLWILIRQRHENVLHAAVVAATDCHVLVTDATKPHHPIVYANPAFFLLTGYTEQEVLGQTASILNGPDTDRASMEKLAMALEDGWACRVRARHYRKDGTSFLSNVSLSPVKDRLGRVTSTVWTMSEAPQCGPLTETDDQARDEDSAPHRLVEQALLDSETRLDLALQVGKVGCFEHDHRTDSLSWSSILRDIYGVDTDEPASWRRYLELVHADDRDRVVSSIQRARAVTGHGLCEIDHRLVRPDGAVRHIRLRSLTWCDGEGSLRQPVRTLGTIADVTDRKHVETRRRETARMEAIGTFVGGIAHELNNGLTAVLGFSELALPLIPADSKAHRHIRQVIMAAKKSRELTQQLMAFGEQSDQGRCPLFLHSLAKESLRLLRPTIPLWIELRAQIAHATNPISAHAVQMHELIFNLVSHALHAMQKTGGVLDVQLQNREFVADQLMPSGRLPAGWYVCLSVRDSGEGMDSERVRRWVNSLVTSRTVSDEQGAGLAVAYGIVTAHGGTLAVESHVGVGTTVSVYLPALPVGCPSTSQKDERLPHGNESVLFVDDEDAVVGFGKEALESLGYHPVVCRTAAEAWEIFHVDPKRFDLLITDRSMPGMSGDRLAQACRGLRPDLPVLLCSGSQGVLGLGESSSQSVTECLLKPLTLHELAYAIRRALGRPLTYPESSGGPAESGLEPSRIASEVSDAVGPRG